LAKTTGIIAVVDTEHDLMAAAEQARLKYDLKLYDAFTPYPVHGLDQAMGVKRSWLPYITFIGGAAGLISAAALEIWTSAVDWPINIGGKPFVSFPAFVPIMFELTVLFGGLITLGALLWACGLPNLTPKILHPAATDDKFVLYIPSKEKNFNESAMTQFLKGLKAEEISVVAE
jgi:hypothetical protein